MKYKISPQQLKLLNKFTIVENGLIPMNLIQEGRIPEYLVSMWISSYPFELRVGTQGGSGIAMQICRRLFPKARIISAKSA
jgi:hypothetical protein